MNPENPQVPIVNAPVPPPPQPIVTSEPVNTSGMGDESVVPEEVKGWSWGGFLWGPIWAIGNKVWIGLLGLIGPISLIIAILLGIYGREWAWKKKKWESIEDFNHVQRNWVKWWFIVAVGGGLIFAIIGILFGAVLLAVNPQAQIQKANCVKNCDVKSATYDACIQTCQTNPQGANLPNNSLESLAVGGGILVTPTPTLVPATPTPKPAASPTPLSTPIPSKYQSAGVQNIGNGVTAVVPTASLSSNIVTISVTFKNTSGSSQDVNLLHVQLHDQTGAGTANKENYFTATLTTGESRMFKMTFNTLPSPPYKIQYAKDDGGLLTLGTYTP